MADRDLTRSYGRAQFVAKLRRLADAIESGRAFTIQVAGERLRSVPATDPLHALVTVTDVRWNAEL